jgi:hypothetical protein
MRLASDTPFKNIKWGGGGEVAQSVRWLTTGSGGSNSDVGKKRPLLHTDQGRCPLRLTQRPIYWSSGVFSQGVTQPGRGVDQQHHLAPTLRMSKVTSPILHTSYMPRYGEPLPLTL